MEEQETLQEAVSLFGTNADLARAINCSAQLVGMMLKGQARISAEIAMRIQVATGNRIMAYELRPDLPWREVRKPKRK